ncbi:putative LTE1 GDP GTP exchange factor [Rosellinia necatrix]|uniref:Putative LTE1 GDP GTP exchange factor n=1 Tax=Rosellinia necatrix TaxID=77044 RepID=A0A1S8AAI2_ROSNE|nr:putative LTE1 GDP GTP exchange factor [Rosellinia necatrix]
MEANPPILRPPLPIRSNSSTRDTPKRSDATRNQRLQKLLGDDARARQSPPPRGTVDKTRPGARTSPTASPGARVPASERRLAEQSGSKTNQTGENEKWSPSADRSAGGRGGRHFTVANVGSNGQIFLRPTARPSNQRYPQLPVALSTAPPNTAGLDALATGRMQHAGVGELNTSQWIPTPMTDPPSPNGIPKGAYFDYGPPATRHRRAISDTTIHDVFTGPEAADPGVFKVVISKPQKVVKSKTAEDLGLGNGPFLQVSIPSWKLGTPRFTLRGTPLIRGSSYAPTEDMRLSHASFHTSSHREKMKNPPHSEPFNPRITSFRSSQSQYTSPAWLVTASDSPSSPMAKSTRPHFMPANLIIESSMFDALTFKPACDDRLIVRYSPTTGAVIAATPPRLVAEITSPSFLDYDLISDFFLTFRSFLEPTDLLRLLIARLRWALSQNDESGMIVKVRTFVAIRHWILNYFVDDFVVDYHLRVTFCDLLNEFTDDLPTTKPKRKVPFKIVGELKKCWRRVCVQYWDGPEFDPELGHDVAITPGGIAGNRDPSLTPSFWDTDSSEAQQTDSIPIQHMSPHDEAISSVNMTTTGHADSPLRGRARPSTPEERILRINQQPTSPTSIASLDVVSCSFPTKALRLGDPNMSVPLGAHPADPSSIYTTIDPIASTPALMAKHMRPQTSHRRNNSLSDSLREHGTPADKVLYRNAEFLLTLPYAGSLVRGNLLPPSQPFVNLDCAANTGTSRQTTVFEPQPPVAAKRKASASAMSGQGMRKLIGSVRRALSTRGLGISHTQGSFIDIAPIGPRGATTNRLPGTAVVPQAQRLPCNGVKRFRIDVLGARIAEDFNQAVREDTAETQSASTMNKNPTENAGENVEYSVAHLDSSFELRPLSDAGITTGSKSIVIVDGTAPPEHFVMTGALPPFNPLAEAYADSMARKHGRSLTPPMTPPSDRIPGNTPRRSSYILSQRVYDASSNADPLPTPNVAGTGAESMGDETIPAQDAGKETRLPISFVAQPSNKPPSAYFNRHKRQQSSRSYRSRGSLSQRRWASFHSDLAARSTVKSFDATTFSGTSINSKYYPNRRLSTAKISIYRFIDSVFRFVTQFFHSKPSSGF